MPNRINTKKTTLRHTTVKLVKTKDKEALLKTDWGKGHIKYKETNIKTITDSSLEIMRAKRQWNDIFKENRLSKQNFISSKNTHKKWEWNKDSFRKMKSKTTLDKWKPANLYYKKY